MSEVAERIRRIPDPGERVPAVSWPALAVFVGALAIWGLSTGFYLADVWS